VGVDPVPRAGARGYSQTPPSGAAELQPAAAPQSQPGAAAPHRRPKEITPRTEKAIERGLAYLAGQQRTNGAWYDYRYRNAMAINSFAMLAMLAGGHTPGRGPYGQHVARSVKVHVEAVQSSGLIAHGIPHHAMYSHGMSTLALAEVYGLTRNERARTALKKATELILRCQNHQGGWRYQPRVHDADISVTVMQVMALRAARNAGIHVPRETIERAVRYVKGCQTPGGGFSYRYKSGPPGFGRTAAGCAALLMAGHYDAPQLVGGLKYLNDNRSKVGKWYWYGHYYAAQAMYQAGGTSWDDWYPFIRDELLRKQHPEGFWRQSGRAVHNNIFETSIALIILQMPYRYLPIFQR